MAHDAPAGGHDPPLDGGGRGGADEARVGDDPDRRWGLHRHQRPELGARVEGDVVVVEVLAVEARYAALGPELPDHGEPLLEDRGAPSEVQPEGLELAPHALLRVPRARAQDRPAVRDPVECRPLERQVERIAGGGHHARGPEGHPRCALGDRRQERDRLVTRLREEAVADPDRVEAQLLDPLREREEHGQVVVGSDQWLAVVQVDAEPQAHGASTTSSLLVASSRCCGTRMWSRRSCSARPGSRARHARAMARCSASELRIVPRSASEGSR